MKALIAMILAAAPGPALAGSQAGDDHARAPGERRVCTRVEVRGASRMSRQRICKTVAEWRRQLGPDWRQHLAGVRSVEEQMDTVETRTRPAGPN